MEAETKRAGRTPVHLWIVGVVSLLWNAMGGFDFLMTQTRNEMYMSQYTADQLSFFYGFPAWVVIVWGVAALGGVLGSVLLLLRSRFATLIFLISLIAMVASAIHNYGFSDGMKFAGDPFSLIFTAVIFLISLGLYIYSRAMQKRGVLR